MAHNNTVLNQILQLVPRHEIEGLSKQHHQGRMFRSANRWSQFVTLVFAQITGRVSLRDVLTGMNSQRHKLYHLGVRLLPRSTLSRLNKDKPYSLYEAVFYRLMHRCKALAPKHGFRFKAPLYLFDSTVCRYFLGLNHQGLIPEFVEVREAACHEVNWARLLKLPQGSVITFDRGFTDYAWYNQLNHQGIFFVTRLKRDANYKVIQRHKVDRSSGLVCDQTIQFKNYYAKKHCSIRLRRVVYKDPETGIRYAYVTNIFHLCARTIADIYKARWQVELFFKWIKQNLKIKTYIGTSKNAVLTQIWIALCVYLMLAYLKFKNRINLSLQQMLRLLHINALERRDLVPLFRGDPIDPIPINHNQLSLI